MTRKWWWTYRWKDWQSSYYWDPNNVCFPFFKYKDKYMFAQLWSHISINYKVNMQKKPASHVNFLFCVIFTTLKSHLSGILDTFLMAYVRRDDVPIHVGLKNISPCVSRSTWGASAEPVSCNSYTTGETTSQHKLICIFSSTCKDLVEPNN